MNRVRILRWLLGLGGVLLLGGLSLLVWGDVTHHATFLIAVTLISMGGGIWLAVLFSR